MKSQDLDIHDQAKAACSTLDYGTLASIHTIRDYNEAKELCSLIGESCWIGLSDMVTEGEYEWEDGTRFDFGSNTITTNNVNEDCVRLSSTNQYNFDDYACDGAAAVNYALCGRPSELCSVNSAWTAFNGNYDGDCTLSIHERSDIIMANRVWYNGIDDDLIIDYMYSFAVTDPLASGDAGIVFYNSMDITVCKYYYIFVLKTNTNNVDLGILYQHGSTTELLNITRLTFSYDITIFNLLSLHVTNGNIFNVYLNDIHVLFIDHSINTNVLSNGYSGYIGIKTGIFATSIAKYLYISGTAWTTPQTIHITNICPTSSPTLPPTNNPSISPTKVTINPSATPTNTPSTNPTIHPSISPSEIPTNFPTSSPTVNPSASPSISPTVPSMHPTNTPTQLPSISPSASPSRDPTLEPTFQPTLNPTLPPSIMPSNSLTLTTFIPSLNLQHQ